MSQSLAKEMRDNCLRHIKECINKKVKIVKEIEPTTINEAKLIGIDPTNKNRLIFDLYDNEEFSKLIIEEGIYIFVSKR